MKKVLYSPDYKEKLIRLRADLDTKYGLATRQKILSEIDHRIQLLKTQPYLGLSLQKNFGIDCDYYFIYAAHNFIFYEVEDRSVNILNMYHEREDYIIKFLGSTKKLQEEGYEFDPSAFS